MKAGFRIEDFNLLAVCRVVVALMSMLLVVANVTL